MSFVRSFDRSIFETQRRVMAVRTPKQYCQRMHDALKDHLLMNGRHKNIQMDPTSPAYRLILLRASELSQIPIPLREWLLQQPSVSIAPMSLQQHYADFSAEEVFRRILPSGIVPPTSFEQVGSIVHVNLDDALLPYKYVIGQVLLDKVPSCRTVVNKVGKIVSPWRTFDMEVLAGEKDTHVTVREGSCVYSFDYSKVYWNARLHREHLRLVDSFSRSDVVADMFCGVGPFALPAAKRGCRVFANDLNPNCFAALRDNIRRNHVERLVTPFNMDARAFVAMLARMAIPVTQVIMNLPASAETFCDVFRTCFADASTPLPRIHCYMFSNQKDPIADSISRLEEVLQRKLAGGAVEGRVVREVAPHKQMTLVSFQLGGK
ncbi:hypothetical protein WA538_001510 [Blastocystis sp. DL]